MHFKPPFLLPEFVFKTSRSGGKGGQNVNKVSTKVQISFDIQTSALLLEEEKQILMERLGAKLTDSGLLQVVSQTERTQLGNKEKALKKLYHLLNMCFVVRKKRKATKPKAGAIEKRLSDKKRNAERKLSRSQRDF